MTTTQQMQTNEAPPEGGQAPQQQQQPQQGVDQRPQQQPQQQQPQNGQAVDTAALQGLIENTIKEQLGKIQPPTQQTAPQESDEDDDGESDDEPHDADDGVDEKDRLKRVDRRNAKLSKENKTLSEENERLKGEIRQRNIMDVVRPEVQDVSDVVLTGTLRALEEAGKVQAPEGDDPKALGKAFLSAIAEHSPELLKQATRQGQGANPSREGEQPAPPSLASQAPQLGSVVQQKLLRRGR